MRHPRGTPRNTALADKLETALTKADRKKRPEMQSRESNLRKRFVHRETQTSQTSQTSTAIMEPDTPSPGEVTAALESIQFSQDQIEPIPSPSIESDPAPEVPPVDGFTLSPATPFLAAYLAKLRDARNLVVFDLEAATKRLTRYQEIARVAQRDVDSGELSVLTLTESLDKIDRNIFECNKLDGMSLEIATLLPQSGHHRAGTERTKALPGDPHVCRKIDVLGFFQRNPVGNWSAREIVEDMPAVKRANAKVNVPSHLSVLLSENKLVRVAPGVYTLAKAVDRT